MHSYSHYSLAARLAPVFQPDRPGEYDWGAIFPDIRYLLKMRRESTHVPREQFPRWFAQHPHLRSFILGYQVHCLLDELNLVQIVGRSFPLNVIQAGLRRKFSRQQITILVELHFLQSSTPRRPFDPRENEIVAALHIDPAVIQTYAQAMQDYTTHPSLQTAFSAYRRLGLVEDDRIEKVVNAGRWLEKNPFLKKLLLLGVKNSGLERIAVEHVRAATRAA